LRNQFDERDISIDLVYPIDGNRSSSFKNIRNWAAGFFVFFLNSRRKWPCHFPEVILLSSACLCSTTTTPQKKGEKRNFGLAVFSVTEAGGKRRGVEPDQSTRNLQEILLT
jgi:hypothetical protein